MALTREGIISELMTIFAEQFEIEAPGLDDDLREAHEFDSIDAIELLVEIERMIGARLTQEEKKQAMEIRTLNQICDYVQAMDSAHA